MGKMGEYNKYLTQQIIVHNNTMSNLTKKLEIYLSRFPSTIFEEEADNNTLYTSV